VASSARIDRDLYASAKLAGSLQSRSASQQVAHWARIGREIEASRTISAAEIHEVLAGSRSYDALTAEEQAEIRAEWSVRMDERRRTLDLAAHFTEEGRRWVELDDRGQVMERGVSAKAPERRATQSQGAAQAKGVVAVTLDGPDHRRSAAETRGVSRGRAG
jgi:hypothetical protein